jgi:peptide/nickel transport system permease protein
VRPQQQIEDIRDRLGLDDPVIVQYGRLVGNLVTRELGTSLYSTLRVTDALRQARDHGVAAGLALLLVVLVGVTFGLLAGSRPGSVLDPVLTLVAALGGGGSGLLSRLT